MIGLGTRARFGFIHAYTEYQKFLQTIQPVPYGSNPVSVHPATYTNICPAGLIVDPLDDTKFLYYQSEFIGPTTVDARTRLFTGGSLSDPYDLGSDQGLLSAGGTDTYDARGRRFGTPIMHPTNGELWYYYIGIDASFKWRICLMTSTDGGRTYTKQGVVLDFNGTTDFSFSGPGVIIDDDGTWLMCYTEWSGTGGVDNNPGVSNVGIKLATSSDGITWTKTGTFLITMGILAQVEDATFYKMGDTYVLLYTARTAENTWGCYMASSKTRNATFNKVCPVILVSGILTACPYLFRFSDGFDYLYYQYHISAGTNDVYVSKHIPII